MDGWMDGDSRIIMMIIIIWRVLINSFGLPSGGVITRRLQRRMVTKRGLWWERESESDR